MKIRQYPFAVASVHGMRMQDPDCNSYLDFLAAGGLLQARLATRRCALNGHRERILAQVVRFPSCDPEKTRPRC
jgi:hypothetical protein